MREIVWKDDFNILIKDMDEPRKFLAEKLSEFLLGVAKRPKIAHIEELNALIDGFRMHFTKEEKLLSKYKYPEADIHRAEHRRYLRHLIKLRRKMSEDPSNADKESIDTIGKVYHQHIEESDVEYAAFVRLKRMIERHSTRR
jgi:hemerythrin